MNCKDIKKRNETLDIIRIFSLFCVISIHFFLNSGFYNEIITGNKMFIMCFFRSLFIICVPMFITLTGYLMNKKSLTKKYYKGIIKTLIIYLFCSIIYHIYEKFYLKIDTTILIFLKKLLSYKGTPYAWYIEMYIGLFLLIPFLNILINNLTSKKQTKTLLYTLFIMIGVPCFFNFNAISSNTFDKILPNWWQTIYPIFYYFLGAYLSQNKLNLSLKKNLILIFITLLLDCSINYYISYNKTYLLGTWNDYCSGSIMILTLLIFNLLTKITIKKENSIRLFIVKNLSDACLGAYLISYIFDNFYYTILNTYTKDFSQKIIFAPIIILFSFISSLLLSLIINIIYKLMSKITIKKGEIYIK